MVTTPTLTPELMREFMGILNALSPENLMCDGERPLAVARRIERALKARWKALEAELGRTVTEDEVWRMFLTTPRTPVGMRVTFR
jgi:hypothetical protein